MADTFEQAVDGSFTLEQQERSLNFAELAKFARVIGYRMSDDEHPEGLKVNDAVMRRHLGDHIPLELVAVGEAENAATVIAELMGEGKTVVFHERAFVEEAETTVIGLRNAT